MLTLHVWMVHKRLLMEGKDGKDIQEALFDELWEDTSKRIRAVGVSELSVNKNLKDVQGYSFRACVELDEALKRESEDEVLEDIGGAVWRFVYLRMIILSLIMS